MRRFIGMVLALFFVLTLGFLVAGAFGFTEGEFFLKWLQRLRADTGSAWLVGAVIALLLMADLFLPVPSSVLMTLSGYFLGWWAGAAMAFAGAMGSAWLGFGLCRVFGQRAFARLMGDDQQRVMAFLERYGAWAILLSRSVPMLTEVMSCVAGLGTMRWSRFSWLSIAGTLPVCLVYAWAGAQTGDTAGIRWAVLIAFVVPAAGFGVVQWLTRSQSRR